MQLGVANVYRDAWRVYRLLMRRSVATAAIVFALLDLLAVASQEASGTVTRIALGWAVFGFGLAGPVLVQGALVEIVRNVHEGRHPERIGKLFARARRRFLSLFWASIVYGVGVLVGLILLVFPGLYLAASWCLMAPLIMLENASAGQARRRSSSLIDGLEWPVALIVVLTFALFGLPLMLFGYFGPSNSAVHYVVYFLWNSLTAPFEAHVLTVLYYRVTDPDRPVIHEDVQGWTSVWEGA